MKFVTVNLDRKGWAWGRNREFTPATVEIYSPWGTKGLVRLDVYSSRRMDSSPITVEISAVDARAVAKAILAGAREARS